ncbi:hypothetical protein V2J09_021824 [Rumex salicifolius]
MSFKGLVRELKEMRDGIGNLSRRGIDRKNWRNRTRSHVAPDQATALESAEQGRWANLPPELLLDIIRRVEASETFWPARVVVISCASVCKSWREITKEIVQTPEICGRLTFPISLKQPGPREFPIQCFIKRDRATSTFRLFFGQTPCKSTSNTCVFIYKPITFVHWLHVTQIDQKETGLFHFILSRTFINIMCCLFIVFAAEIENDKLMLAAKRVRRAASTDFIISLVTDDFSRASNTYLGKLRQVHIFKGLNIISCTKVGKFSNRKHFRSNFLGTKFTIYDSQPPSDVAVKPSGRCSRRFSSKQVSPRLSACNYSIATISYELNVLRTRGPRKLNCTMNSIPISSIQEGGSAPTPKSLPNSIDGGNSSDSPASLEKGSMINFSSTSLAEPLSSKEPLILKNKAPRWHEQLQCWCLNFRGRVTVASVKNFQLVAAVEQRHNIPEAEQEKVILQFGKIGTDIFTMDYCYPLSAFQAFAICLSSFDTKPACE